MTAVRVRPRVMALEALVLALVLVLVLALAFAAGAQAAGARTVWLCRPGQHPDPCTPGLSTTVYSPRLAPLPSRSC